MKFVAILGAAFALTVSHPDHKQLLGSKAEVEGCRDLDGLLRDKRGYWCEMYEDQSDIMLSQQSGPRKLGKDNTKDCGKYDDWDFKANFLCCACGGGI